VKQKVVQLKPRKVWWKWIFYTKRRTYDLWIYAKFSIL